MNIFISITLTAFIYMIFPFIFLFNKAKKYSNKKITIFLICNSVIIKLLTVSIEYEISNNINITPAVLYFFINQAIWCKNKKVKQNILKNEINKNSNSNTWQEHLKKNYKATGTRTKMNDIKINSGVLQKSTEDEENLLYNEKELNKMYKKEETIRRIRPTVTYIILIISILSNIILASLSISQSKQLNRKQNETDELYSKIRKQSNSINSLNSDLNYLTGFYTKEYIKQKIIFFDNNIVFVIDGYGNYYSDYDCMLQRAGNSNYRYLALNEEAAIGRGYQEYKCN